MAYDRETADRVRRMLAVRDDVVEKRMVGGGLSFSVGGRMCCGVTATGLLVRLGRDGVTAALAEPHVGPMVLGGRTLSGFVLVDRAGYATDPDLAAWVRRALALVAGHA
ncbi:TfoX N-terminal domain-containing protein [Geodermatophilus telluris]|uniref:TfoX N-terminal domain-containing protein n=1 Tax=Geodermatophilus telluris TaxID=1190417 RepID=A0A1G6SHC6_9ACTN|nr:TfoX/Sxy family protein [Geodermatophilus telluris]SDD16269.1 TfoX N-terminal domain-containing protein [Geodermatophilus telluris]